MADGIRERPVRFAKNGRKPRKRPPQEINKSVGYLNSNTLQALLCSSGEQRNEKVELPMLPCTLATSRATVSIIPSTGGNFQNQAGEKKNPTRKRKLKTSRLPKQISVLKPSYTDVMMPGDESQSLENKLAKSSKNRAKIDNQIESNVQWIRSNVPIVLLRSQKYSMKWGLDTLNELLHRIHTGFIGKAWEKWNLVIQEQKQDERLLEYRQSSAALNVMKMLNRALLESQRRSWKRWQNEVLCQNHEELHAAVVQIQCNIRRFLLRNYIEELTRNRAATSIQKHYRRKIATRNLRKLIHTERCRQSAIVIQNLYRSRRSRQFVHLLATGNRRDKAVRVIQKNLRACSSRVNWIRRRQREMEREEAASRIQRCFRCHEARQVLSKAKRLKAACTVQRCWHNYIHTLSSRRQKVSKFVQETVLTTMHHLGAVIIQSWARCILARWALRYEREYVRATQIVQAYWRGSQARKEAAIRREKMHKNRLERYICACCIQKAYRNYKERVIMERIIRSMVVPIYMRARNQDQAFRFRFRKEISASGSAMICKTILSYVETKVRPFKQRDRASLRIQTCWRGFKGRLSHHLQSVARKQRAREMNEAATTIQRLYKGREARQIARSKRNHLEMLQRIAYEEMLQAAALRVQTAWRRRQGQFALHLKRQALKYEEDQKCEAACTIQRFFRQIVTWKAATAIRSRKLEELAMEMEKRRQIAKIENDAVRIIQRLFKRALDHKPALVTRNVQLTKMRRRRQNQERLSVILGYLEEKNREREEERQFEQSLRGVLEEEERRKSQIESGVELEGEAHEAEGTSNTTVEQENQSEWVEYWDEEYQVPYYFNRVTGETSW